MNYVKSGAVSAICGAALAATLGAVPSGGVSAQQASVDGPKVEWLVSLWGQRRGLTEGIEKLAEELSETTGGKFTLNLQYGGVLSEPAENIDGLQFGAFEAAMLCPGYHPEKTPTLSAVELAMLPITSLQQRANVMNTYYKHPAVAADLARWNTHILMTVVLPGYEIMGSGEVPKSLSDFDGRRVSASTGVGDLMRGIGASVAHTPAPEMYQALERGVIDSVVFPWTYAFASYRLDEVSTWMTDGWQLGAGHCLLAANMDAYNALPPQYKDLIDASIQPSYDWQFGLYRAADEKNIAQFQEEGLVWVELSAEDRTALQDAAAPSWQAWVDGMEEKGYPGQELLDYVLEVAASSSGS
ncbi:TRAP transporter substrate-binding protein DctP [Antarctobacter sp.]|uniref:TRAP transporter substrate-binding protein DctP n=1 Tax=Antarctobacter sp. TaxID=1872577 RepID=UPI003A8D8BCF